MAKKIKKVINPTNTNDLLQFIKVENDKKQEGGKHTPKQYKNNPTQRPAFKKWKTKEVPDWTSVDFLGYYLHKYLEKVGSEDADFKRAAQYRFGEEAMYVRRCFAKFFEGEEEKFKKYIDWILPWWLSDESFVTDLPSFRSIFTSKSSAFLKKFEGAQMQSRKVTKKKVVKTRKEADNQFSNKDAWDKYFDGDDENVSDE